MATGSKQLIESIFQCAVGNKLEVEIGQKTTDYNDVSQQIKAWFGTWEEKTVFHFEEYHLLIYASDWRIDLDFDPIIGSNDELEIQCDALCKLDGKRLLNFSILNDSFDALLEFESGYNMHIFSCSVLKNEAWVLFAPENKAFIAGPGEEWDYTNTDD